MLLAAFREKQGSRRGPSPGAALAALILLPGCITTEEIAPPVAMLGAVTGGSSAGQLEQGRRIYLTKCTKCHAAEPVRAFSEAEWRALLPEMAEDTKLTAGEEAAVLAYVVAASKVPAPAG